MTEYNKADFAFADRVEDLLKELVDDISIPIFRFFMVPEEGGGCRGELYLLFPDDLHRVDALLREEFSVDNDASETVNQAEEKGELALAEYLFSLKAPRGALREWKPFEGKQCRLRIGTVLQGASDALNVCLKFNDESTADPKALRKLVRMNALLEEAEEGYRILVKQAGQPVPEEGKKDFFSSSDEKEELRSSSDEGLNALYSRSDVESATEEEISPAADRVDLASLRLFFSTHVSLLELWEKQAAQREIAVVHPPVSRQEESLRGLALLLNAAEIKDTFSLEKELKELDATALGARLDTLRHTFGEAMDAWEIDPYALVFLVLLDVKWEVLKDKDLDEMGIKAVMERIRGSENQA